MKKIVLLGISLINAASLLGMAYNNPNSTVRTDPTTGEQLRKVVITNNQGQVVGSAWVPVANQAWSRLQIVEVDED